MSDFRTILALFPFLTKGHFLLAVLREMRCRDLDLTLSFCDETTQYVLDPVDDFAQGDRLVDFSKLWWSEQIGAIEREIERRNVGLILQIGASPMYRHLPFIKEKFPGVKIVDLLYNDKGHVIQHFLFETAIDGVIVESEYMRMYVERSSAKKNPNIWIVKSGVSLESFTTAPEVPRRGLTLGYLGRMSEEKNPFGFIALAEEIHSARPDTIFLMSGGGKLETEVRERIEMSIARQAFRYDGHSNDPRALLQQLDALILPSLTDGRPNVIMEANACGVPVIAAPVGGIPEMIEVGVNGYLFPSTAVAPILETLSHWHNDRQSLAAIKCSSRDFAERFFDRRGMMDSYERVFKDLLSC